MTAYFTFGLTSFPWTAEKPAVTYFPSAALLFHVHNLPWWLAGVYEAFPWVLAFSYALVLGVHEPVSSLLIPVRQLFPAASFLMPASR